MFVEQIRYFVTEETADQVMEARREVSRIRSEHGLPDGYILVADPLPDEGPGLIWQCGYDDDSQMAVASSALIGNAEYEAARDRLAGLVERVEIELYTSGEDGQE